jgi:hypothetical protein
MMIKSTAACFIILLFTSLTGFSQSQFFVSVKGNDQNIGTKENPFASISRAQAEARNRKGNVIIYIREGVYYLKEPIVFRPEDSRGEKEMLILKAYAGEKVVLSGGQPFALQWRDYKNGIKQASVNDNIQLDELFVNGILQHMARFPNYNLKAKFFNGASKEAISPEHIKKWKNPEGGYIHALHPREWGSYHFLIKGKNDDGNIILERRVEDSSVVATNRTADLHRETLFAENIFEELDTVNEWYYNKNPKTLFYYPSAGTNLSTAKIVSPQLESLVQFKGSEEKPVRNISIEGIGFTQTLRTFMKTTERLSRGDWSIYRGGAVLMEGTENCTLKNCSFTNLGGNAVFFNNYNRNNEVSGCLFKNIGASAVCFSGDKKAHYDWNVPLDKIDLHPGPKTNNYPAKALVYDNLMHDLGQFEKQVAGVHISMSQDVTVRHNTIYNVPRAGINVNDGMWGGHLIEYNEVFNTVLETGDHGAFNSWGRDRNWIGKKNPDSLLEHYRDKVALLDNVKPTIIRGNRFRCDYGWDIDLDDGATNYIIYNNVLLNGGLKFREGFFRTAENNIIINNSFHPHVWYKNSDDIFRRNVVTTSYFPVGQPDVWTKEIDYNIFLDSIALRKSKVDGRDAHSVYSPPLFVNAATGDYRFRKNSPAFSVGFKNFDMDHFGVVSQRLKSQAQKVPLPKLISFVSNKSNEVLTVLGLDVKNMTLGERSATAMFAEKGAFVVRVNSGSRFYGILKPKDVILAYNEKEISTLRDFQDAAISPNWTDSLKITVFREGGMMNLKLKK